MKGLACHGRPFTHFLNLIWLRGENEGAVLTTGRSRRRAGAGAWSIQMETARLSDQGEDVIFLTVGEHDLAAWEPVIDSPERGAFRGPGSSGAVV